MYRALRQIFLRQPLPATTKAELDALLEAADRYSNPAMLRDPDRLFMPSEEFQRLPPVRRKKVRGGTLSHFRLPTPYRPIDPNYSDKLRRYEGVQNVHVFAWRHPTPAPLSILLLHGWGVGSRRLHEVEFSIGTLFRRLGLDVYFYVAPFHGLRRPAGFRSGELHPSIDIIRSNEAFVQTVQELRALITMIKAERSAPIGVMGSSLGGYTSALLASIDDRLEFAVPIIAPASLADLFWERSAGEPIQARARAMGLTIERFRAAWAMHSPLSYSPKIALSHRLIIDASDDALVPRAHVDVLWEHWQRPRRFEFAGGHILQVGRRAYVRELSRWFRELGLLPEIS